MDNNEYPRNRVNNKILFTGEFLFNEIVNDALPIFNNQINFEEF